MLNALANPSAAAEAWAATGTGACPPSAGAAAARGGNPVGRVSGHGSADVFAPGLAATGQAAAQPLSQYINKTRVAASGAASGPYAWWDPV
jgi:hypothetical protein